MVRAAIVLAAVLSFGCATRKAPDAYRLTRQGNHAVLIPPGVPNPAIDRFTVKTPDAGPARCDLSGVITAQRRGRDLRIVIARDGLTRQPAGWLTQWAGDAEAKGCIAPGSAAAVAGRIAESLPLDPAAAWRLLNLNDVRAGHVDLAAGNRLQVDSPIFRPGTPPDQSALASDTITGGSGNSINIDVKASPDLIGYERAWYAVRRGPGSVGLSIEPLTAERHVDGQTEMRPAPSTNHLAFDRASAYYRLLYRADRTIVVLGAGTRAELERLSHSLTDDTRACQALAGHSCAIIPANVGVNPELLVTVNGREHPLPIGSTMTSAIRAGGARPDEVLARLTVMRPYAGRLVRVEFDRSATDILNLRLNGGEVLMW